MFNFMGLQYTEQVMARKVAVKVSAKFKREGRAAKTVRVNIYQSLLKALNVY